MDQVPSVAALIEDAIAGRQAAWNTMVRRFIPLVFAVIRRYRFTPTEQQDIAQCVWLKLYENLGRIRDPGALPGWLAVTTKHEALRASHVRGRSLPFDPQLPPPGVDVSSPAEEMDEDLLRAERNQMLRDAFAELPEKQRTLLMALAEDPAPTYKEVSSRLNIPIGSIGPFRERYLNKLRATEAMTRYYAPHQMTDENVKGQIMWQPTDDDDQLINEIRAALEEVDRVPRGSVEAAEAIAELHNIDSELELLTLMYDSSLETTDLTRGSSTFVAARYLTFQHHAITLEVEVGTDAVLGQVIPAQPATISIVTPSGVTSQTETDDLGTFFLSKPAASVIRLTCATASGGLRTTWISLRSMDP